LAQFPNGVEKMAGREVHVLPFILITDIRILRGLIRVHRDSPVVFGMDSPANGGLVCSSTVISADLWRLGQVKPGGYVKLTPTTYERAMELADRVESFIHDIPSLVGETSASVPSLDLMLPPTPLEKELQMLF
jgi:allophanate hydrolase subunit 2